MDENVYYKNDKGRYIPIGLQVMDYLPDGIWYVRHKKYSRAKTNMAYLEGLHRLAGAKDLSFDVIAGVEDIVDKIFESPEMKAVISKPCSLTDIVRATVIQIINKNQDHAKI